MPELRRLRDPGAVVLRDLLSGDLGDRRLGPEAAPELAADLLILADRPLAFRSLVIEVLRHKLTERLRGGRRRWRVTLEPSPCQRLLRILVRPGGIVAPLLLPVDLEGIAPGAPADPAARRPAAPPCAFDDSGHVFLLSVHSERRRPSTCTLFVCILWLTWEEQGPCIDGSTLRSPKRRFGSLTAPHRKATEAA